MTTLDDYSARRDFHRSRRRQRPALIDPARPGQESVWDYPRPPRIERISADFRVHCAGKLLISAARALRVLETSSPPVYYFSSADVDMARLVESNDVTFCEWKGLARHCDIVGDVAADGGAADGSVARGAWIYLETYPEFHRLLNTVAVYPQLMDGCWLNGEQARAVAGSWYGGWITRAVTGPFKGAAGSEDW